MALYGESIVVSYYCWNKLTGDPVTGDASNHTVSVIRDGTAATATNSPQEISSSTSPGWYRVTLTSTEMQADTIAVDPRSSTTNVLCTKAFFVTEKGRIDQKISDPKTLTSAERQSIAQTVLTTPLSSVESSSNAKTLAWLIARFFNRVAIVGSKFRTYKSDRTTTYFEQNVVTGDPSPIIEIDDTSQP